MSQWQQDPILDRGEGRRSEPGWATDAWQHPRAQILGVDANGHVSADEDGLRWVAAEGACDPQRHFMLGLWADRPIFITPIAHGDRLSLIHI